MDFLLNLPCAHSILLLSRITFLVLYFHEITYLSIVLILFIHNISSKHDRETAASLLRRRRQIVKNFYLHFQFLDTFPYEAKARCFQIVMLINVHVFMSRNSARLKSTFYLENDFGRKKVDFFRIQFHRTFRLFHFVIALMPWQLRQLLCYPPN